MFPKVLLVAAVDTLASLEVENSISDNVNVFKESSFKKSLEKNPILDKLCVVVELHEVASDDDKPIGAYVIWVVLQYLE